MNSEVSICNVAMTALGQGPIQSLDSDEANARVCKDNYESVRDELLSSYDWPFARARKELSADAGVNLTPYKFRYNLPNDFLQMLCILEPVSFVDSTAGWEKEGKFLLCDSEPCYIKYTARITNPALFPNLVATAIGMKLAARIADKVTQNAKLAAKVDAQAQLAVLVAMGIQNSNSKKKPEPEGNWSDR